MEIYTVGGAVRDKLLGLEPKDIDYVVVGATEDDMLSLGFSKVGADFPVFLHPRTNDEYALARTERKVKAGYHGFEVNFGVDVKLEDDLIRRDLTINSIAMDINGNIFDPWGGMQDLNDKILRHTSVAFAEDPVRVLRLARFAARYPSFTIAEETLDLIHLMVKSGELDSLVPERVWAEFAKGLMDTSPWKMVKVLHDTGALEVISNAIHLEVITTARLQEELETVVINDLGLSCRFAILAKNFGPSDFDAMKLPGEMREIAYCLRENLTSLQQFNRLDELQITELFTKLDVIRRLDRFDRVVDLAFSLGEVYGNTIDRIFINKMVKAFMINNCGEIAGACENPANIKSAISHARMKSVQKAMSTLRDNK